MTIKDIARLSGYGIGTVSRVLNNHSDVSDKARKKIGPISMVIFFNKERKKDLVSFPHEDINVG